MRTRALCAAAMLAASLTALGAATDETPEETRKKARRVSSYVAFCETVGRVGIQVGGMAEHHPYDKAVVTYAREISRLHARLFTKLSPPEGAETLHKRFKDAVTEFAKAAEAHYQADYSTAHKHRQKAVHGFVRALAEVGKLRRQGTIPAYAPAGGGKK